MVGAFLLTSLDLVFDGEGAIAVLGVIDLDMQKQLIVILLSQAAEGAGWRVGKLHSIDTRKNRFNTSIKLGKKPPFEMLRDSSFSGGLRGVDDTRYVS